MRNTARIGTESNNFFFKEMKKKMERREQNERQMDRWRQRHRWRVKIGSEKGPEKSHGCMEGLG